MEKQKRKAIVLLSGGIDSMLCLDFAISEGLDTVALFFDYGQRQLRQESEAVTRLAAHYHVPLMRLELDFSFMQKTQCMLNPKVEVNKYTMDIPMRNLIFLAHAAAVAETLNVHEICSGVRREDTENFPDCSLQFVQAFEYLIPLCTNSKRDIKIHMPLFHASKRLVMRIVKGLELPLDMTWSCYDPKEGEACQLCPACIAKQEALDEYDK